MTTASVRSIVVQVAAYAGVAMGLAGTFALVATTAQPSETTLLLVAVAVTAVLFAAGIAISKDTVSSNQRLRSVLWFAALFGWAAVVEGVLVVAEIDLDGRSRQLLSTVLIASGAVGLWVGLRRSLQLLGMFFSLFAVLSTVVFPQTNPFGGPSDVVAPTVLTWLFGAAWMVLGARGVTPPGRTALVLGTITVLVSPFALGAGGVASEATLTIVELWILGSGVACLAVGTWLADGPSRASRSSASWSASPPSRVTCWGVSQGGSIAAVVLGSALLGGAVVAIRRSRTQEPLPFAPAGTLPEPPAG